MLKTLNTLWIALLFTGSFAVEPDCGIIKRQDKSSPGIVIYESAELILLDGKLDSEYCYLQPCCYVEESTTDYVYVWRLFYLGEHWKFITGIRLLLDGKVVAVENYRAMREAFELEGVSEVITYLITDQIYQAVDRAKSVSVRVVASQGGSIDHDFDSAELHCIRQFRAQIREKFE